MSALRNQPSLRSAPSRFMHGRASVPAEQQEQCDGCRRMLSLWQVELTGPQILCVDCAPAEFTATLHPHLPAHPRLRVGARL